MNSILKAVFLVLAIAAAGVFFLKTSAVGHPTVRVDKTTMCAVDRPVTWSGIAVIDATDNLSDLHLEQTRAALRELRASVPVGGLVRVVLVDEARPFEGTELLRLCNPGRGSDPNRYIHESRIAADHRWERAFNRPFDELLAKTQTSPDSPIVETITGLSLRPDFSRAVPTRVLVLISDGLQNHKGDGFTHYTNGDRWTAYKKSGLAKGPQADLAGVAVHFVYLMRLGDKAMAYQNPAHRAWWDKWLREAGATHIDMTGAPALATR